MKYYIDDLGSYLGGTDGDPLSLNEVPFPPDDVRQIWNGSDYDPVSAAVIAIENTLIADFEVTFGQPEKALALVTLSELNILRVAAGFSERTVQQLKDAIEARL